MSNDLTDVRTSIVAALTAADLRALVIVPERFTPPAVVLAGDDPYVTRDGAGFGALVVRHRLTAIASAGVNEVTAEALDAMTLDVLDALDATEHVVTDVEPPGQAAVNGQAYPALYLHVETEIQHRA